MRRTTAEPRRLMRRVAMAAAVACVAGAALGVVASQVDTTLSDVDREAIRSLDLDAACSDRSGYEDEVGCVRALQEVLVERVPDLRCVHEWGAVSHEPADFLIRARGCCYDRSRLIEKTLTHYGFEVRHLSLYQAWPAPLLNLVTPGVRSHSLSEVRTARGWMVVDSNQPFLALTRDGDPLDARALRRTLVDHGPEALESPPSGDFFDGRYNAYYGLYSRHGGFYAPYAPVPDVDWRQVRHNL